MANAECGIGGNECPPICFSSAFRRSRRVRSAHQIAGAKKRCASAPYKLLGSLSHWERDRVRERTLAARPQWPSPRPSPALREREQKRQGRMKSRQGTPPLLLPRSPHVELQLPAVGFVARYRPQFQSAHFGHMGMQAHWNRHPFLTDPRQRGLQRCQLFEVFTGLLDQGAKLILTPGRRAQKAELCRFAHDQAEFLAGDITL